MVGRMRGSLGFAVGAFLWWVFKLKRVANRLPPDRRGSERGGVWRQQVNVRASCQNSPHIAKPIPHQMDAPRATPQAIPRAGASASSPQSAGAGEATTYWVRSTA